MRYTTIIDITEVPTIYRNQHARLLYLHMVLKCGYHDDDRDILDLSIRNLAQQTGLSVSTIRHALRILERAALIQKQGNAYIVRKWLPQEKPSPRAPQEPPRPAKSVGVLRTQEEAQRDQERERAREAMEFLQQRGKTSFMVWYESLMEKANAGDLEAAEQVRRHRQTYEAHRAQRELETKKKRT